MKLEVQTGKLYFVIMYQLLSTAEIPDAVPTHRGTSVMLIVYALHLATLLG